MHEARRVYIEDDTICIDVKDGYQYWLPITDFFDTKQIEFFISHLSRKRWMTDKLLENVRKAVVSMQNKLTASKQ